MISLISDKPQNEPKKPLCGKIVKTIENTRLPCLRPAGHPGGSNPFSDSPTPTG
jgi:hypothetical protein